MNVLLVSNSLHGGANRAMLRHNAALRAIGVHSHILTGRELPQKTPYVFSLPFLAGQFLQQKKTSLAERIRVLPELDIVKSADIIEFRSLHNGGAPDVLDVRMLEVLYPLGKPLVWRLSDMWAFTGFCPYAYDCNKWETLCDACPQISKEHEHMRELRLPLQPVDQLYERKKQVYACVQSGLHIVCPSQWIKQKVEKSILSGCASITHVPVGVELDVYRPGVKAKLRNELGLPYGKTLIAASIPNPANYRKAADLLFEVLAKLPDDSFALLAIGAGKYSLPPHLGHIQLIPTEYLTDNRLQAKFLAAADIHCFTSRCDNSAQTLCEATACGTTTVCFDVGGNSEYVIDGETGILIPPFDVDLMAEAITDLATNTKKREELGKNAVIRAKDLCGINQQTSRYVTLYKNLLQASQGSESIDYKIKCPTLSSCSAPHAAPEKKVLIFSPNTGGHRHLFISRFVSYFLNQGGVRVYLAHAGLLSNSKKREYLPHESPYIASILKEENVSEIRLPSKLNPDGFFPLLSKIQEENSIDATLIIDGDELLFPLTKEIQAGNTPVLHGKNYAIFILSEFVYLSNKPNLRGFTKEWLTFLFMRYFPKTPLFDGLLVADENIVYHSKSKKYVHLYDIPQVQKNDAQKNCCDPFEMKIQQELHTFLQLNHGRDVILSFGDLEKRKGFSFLLRLAYEDKNTVLLRIGRTKPGYSPTWDDVFWKEGLLREGRLFFVDSYLKNTDFLFDHIQYILLPYQNFYRTSGVFIDSVVRNIPVLVPDIGLNAQRVKANHIGLIFRHCNYDDFKAKFNEMRHNYHQFASGLQQFSSKISNSAFENIAGAVLGKEIAPGLRGDSFTYEASFLNKDFVAYLEKYAAGQYTLFYEANAIPSRLQRIKRKFALGLDYFLHNPTTLLFFINELRNYPHSKVRGLLFDVVSSLTKRRIHS